MGEAGNGLPVKWTTETPCESCPYRRDAKLARWDRSEFKRLLAQDKDPMGAMFACHGSARTEHAVCAGWLLDQKRRDLPSIQLRLALTFKAEARRLLEVVTDKGHALYDSIKEMCDANEKEDGGWGRATRATAHKRSRIVRGRHR
jgi:hypothetical protein